MNTLTAGTALGRLEDQPEDFERRQLQPGAPEVWEDGVRLTETNPGAYEWWYMDGHFTNGMMLVVTFFTYVGAEGAVTPRVIINISNADGVIVDQELDFAPGDLDTVADHADVTVKSSHFRSVDGLKAYEIHVAPEENNGFGCTVRLDSRTPSHRPGTGYWSNDADENYFAWLCVVPEGRMTGTLAMNGETVEVEGSGYHDHNWGNVPMDMVLGRWYWGRGEIDGASVVLATVWFNEAYGATETHTLMVAKDGERVLTLVNDEAQHLDGNAMISPDTGRRVNSDMMLVAAEGEDRVRFRGNQIVATSRPDRSNPEYLSSYTRFAATTTLDIDAGGVTLRGKGPSVLEYIDFYVPKA